MKNQSRINRKNRSQSATAPQSKTEQNRTRRARPSCLCIYQAGQLAGELPLVGRLLPSVITTAVRQGVSLDQFISGALNGNLVRGPLDSITCVWIMPNGREAARVDFPHQVFSRIVRAASQMGITLQQFMDNAIRNFIKAHAGRRAS
jgi:hypothetical protein